MVFNTSSDLQEQPLILKKQGFDYEALEAGVKIVVQQCTSEIKTILRRSTLDIFEIGQRLIDVKETLGHGYFLDWVKAEFEWDERTARRYMNVAGTFGPKSDTVSDLDITPTALYVLAAPSTPDSARNEALARAEAGQSITPTIARTIVNEYKPVTKQTKATKPVTVDVPVSASIIECQSSVLDDIEESENEDELDQTEPMRYATPSYTIEEVAEPAATKGEADRQKPPEKEGEPATQTDLSVKPLDGFGEGDQSEDSLLEKAPGANSQILVQPEETDEIEMPASSKQGKEDEEQSNKELLENVVKVNGSGIFISNGHQIDGTSVLPDAGRNHFVLAEVGDHSSVNPPRVDSKIAEICKTLNKIQQFSDEERRIVFEALLYHIGTESLSDLLVRSIHPYQRVDLCHKCFDVMDAEAFSTLEVNRMKIPGFRDSALEFLYEEVSQLLIERHIKKL